MLLTELPIELLGMVFSDLQQSHHLGSLASLQRTCKIFHTLTTPYIYRNVIISEVRLMDLLKTIGDTLITHRDIDMSSPISKISPPSGYRLTIATFEATRKVTLIESTVDDGAPPLYKDTPILIRRVASIMKRRMFINLKYLEIHIRRNPSSLFTCTISQLAKLNKPKAICIHFLQDASDGIDQDSLRSFPLLPLLGQYSKTKDIKVIAHHAYTSIVLVQCFLCYEMRVSVYDSDLSFTTWASNLGILSSCLLLTPITTKLRIILHEGDGCDGYDIEEIIQDTLERCETAVKLMHSELSQKMKQKTSLPNALKWIRQIEWVYGDKVKEEPPCEICGCE
ncbi:uncharacterized protein I206_102798 [Kwoniella pini CBS 10737]|uniref:F-box domain-containing protein n=1 Tax=Kwoniella pini CBS 10737 TaxID=1296096 RepID=A0A1B9I6D2_9TREE|nr:uncharacterized protein I206_03152 [Kwoniella pini CBS 10737]OCF51086.1 hypothetical protein I206_03152 [Kwoniella pini CBS 10737]